MVVDIMGKLSVMKAAKLVEGYLDLFVGGISSSSNNNNNNNSTTSAAAAAAATAGSNEIFDSNSMYNVSVLQQLLASNTMEDSTKLNESVALNTSKYEIRYRLLDLLSDIDQYV